MQIDGFNKKEEILAGNIPRNEAVPPAAASPPATAAAAAAAPAPAPAATPKALTLDKLRYIAAPAA